MPGPYVLAIDAGSSSVRAMLVAADGDVAGSFSRPMAPKFPRPGWVEFDPEHLWQIVVECIAGALGAAGSDGSDVASVGVTSHRETVMVWDRATGAPVHDAVMWLSKQTDDIVRGWSEQGLDPLIRERTGLRNDSYFSAGKLAWLLEHVPGVRRDAEAGRLAAGTPDTWLLWKLTGGAAHRTDPSCASRTALLNLERRAWDAELCDVLGIPLSLMAEIVPSDAEFGRVDAGLLASQPPVTGVLADQQAGLYGQACTTPGDAKNTFGTAGVLVVNAGERATLVPGTTSSVAWQLGGGTAYEYEGVVFHAGQTLHWLRDRMGIADAEALSGDIAESVSDTGGVYFVPGFAGLCDPHWDRNARAAIVGITLETDKAHIVRAALEAMAYQTLDNVDALAAGGVSIPMLRVDGGAARNDFLCQFQADVLGIPVERPRGLERTALGVAQVAGAGVGLWDETGGPAATRRVDRVFEPLMGAAWRDQLVGGWRDAVATTRAHPPARSAAAPAADTRPDQTAPSASPRTPSTDERRKHDEQLTLH